MRQHHSWESPNITRNIVSAPNLTAITHKTLDKPVKQKRLQLRGISWASCVILQKSPAIDPQFSILKMMSAYQRNHVQGLVIVKIILSYSQLIYSCVEETDVECSSQSDFLVQNPKGRILGVKRSMHQGHTVFTLCWWMEAGFDS